MEPSLTICFEDLRRSADAQENLKNQVQKLVASLPEGQAFRLEWRNIRNKDPKSDGYNPLKSTGRFYAVSEDKEVKHLTQEGTFQNMDKYMGEYADNLGVVTTSTIV